jgi:hypothetical protein
MNSACIGSRDRSGEASGAGTAMERFGWLGVEAPAYSVESTSAERLLCGHGGTFADKNAFKQPNT